jgi:putative membrane protein
MEIIMNRRHLLIGAAATAVSLSISGTALSQGAGVEKSKLSALMGGDFATATSQLALRKANHRAVKTFAELEIKEQAAVAEAFGSQPRPDCRANIPPWSPNLKRLMERNLI